MYFTSKRTQSRKAIERLRQHYINIPKSEESRFFWKLTLVELLKKYLGEKHEYVISLTTFQFINLEKDNPDMLWKTFGEIDVEKKAKEYVEKSINWIDEHGTYREPILKFVMEYWDLFALVVTVAAIVTGLFLPLLQNKINSKNDDLLKSDIPIQAKPISVDSPSISPIIQPKDSIDN